ncbi:MAG: Universal stress protein family [Geminicoccaceae bacterium]|nr:Universal stress protein family [Geminicoccaceae bacterium]
MYSPDVKRTVLVPIFGGDISDDALATARAFLDRRDSRLVLLHVVPSEDVELAPGESALDPDVEPRWHRLAAAAAPDRTFVEVVHGDPAQEVLDEAERFGSDVIVVGPHASTTDEDWTDRVIAQLVRAAPRRVFVASHRNRPPRTRHRHAAMRRRVFAHRRFHAA